MCPSHRIFLKKQQQHGTLISGPRHDWFWTGCVLRSLKGTDESSIHPSRFTDDTTRTAKRARGGDWQSNKTWARALGGGVAAAWAARQSAAARKQTGHLLACHRSQVGRRAPAASAVARARDAGACTPARRYPEPRTEESGTR